MVLLFQLLHSKISLFYGTFFTCDIMKKFFLFYLTLPFVFCDIFGCFLNFKVHTYLYPIKVHVHREQNQNIISSQLHSEFVFNSCLTHCDFTSHCISLPIHHFVTLHHILVTSGHIHLRINQISISYYSHHYHQLLKRGLTCPHNFGLFVA